MKRYKVTGYIDLAVTTIVEVEDGEELTKEEICARAYDAFESVGNYTGFGDCNHLIGVSGNEENHRGHRRGRVCRVRGGIKQFALLKLLCGGFRRTHIGGHQLARPEFSPASGRSRGAPSWTAAGFGSAWSFGGVYVISPFAPLFIMFFALLQNRFLSMRQEPVSVG